jgi:hypothetical protein
VKSFIEFSLLRLNPAVGLTLIAKEFMSKANVVTNVGQAPEAERARRFLIYTISMIVRFACVILVVFTSGIWQWVFGLGAVFLPYFAVVIGNNAGGSSKSNLQTIRVEPLAIDVSSHIKRDQ